MPTGSHYLRSVLVLISTQCARQSTFYFLKLIPSAYLSTNISVNFYLLFSNSLDEINCSSVSSSVVKFAMVI